MAWYIFVTFTSGDGFGQGRMNCLNVKHWMGTAQQGREEQVSVDTMAAGACGSYSPALTLELDEPVVKRGSEVTYRSVMTSATRRSRSGVCSIRNLEPRVPTEGSLRWPGRARVKENPVDGCCQ